MFYTRFKELCDETGVRPTAVMRKLGISPSSPGRWKAGAVPYGETVRKLADYFGVTADYLLHGGERTMRNSMGTVQNSAIVQGSVGSSVSVNNGDQLQGSEAELISVFRSLDRKGQIAVLNFAYEQETAQK
nr:MAG TPA: hypothetical protein [Caudoviricetes sp.]